MVNIISKTITITRIFVIVTGTIYLLSGIFISIFRVFYPFSILNVEDACFQVLYAFYKGIPIYSEPNLHYISIVYTPLYFYISYIISFLIGFGYTPLRLLSLLSSLGLLLLIYLIVKKETKSKYLAFASIILYILSYPLSGNWQDLAKPDSLMLLFLFISFYLMRYYDSMLLNICAGILLALSYLTKQQALSMSLLVLLYIIIVNHKKGIIITSSTIISIILSHIILNIIYNDWFSYFTFILPSKITYVTIMINKLVNFITKDIIMNFPLAVLLISLYILLSYYKKNIKRELFFLILLISFGIGILPTRIIYGGSVNSLMPMYAIIATITGIAAGKLLTYHNNEKNDNYFLRFIVHMVLALQVIILLYNPFVNLPTSSQWKDNEQTIKAIRAYPGDVFVENYGHLAVMAGKEDTPHFGTVDDILIGDKGEVRKKIVEAFKTAFDQQHYSMVLLEEQWLNYDFNDEILKELENNYNYIGMDPSDRFRVFLPKEAYQP